MNIKCNLFTVKDIERYIIPLTKIEITGSKDRIFKNLCSLNEGTHEGLSFCTTQGNNAIPLLEESKAGIILCWNDVDLTEIKGKTLIFVDNPRFWFIACAKYFFPQKKQSGIHSSAIIGENCIIDDEVYIGPFSIIGDNVTIKCGTSIGSHVSIFDNVNIGRGVKIKSGCVIGSEGFGFEKNKVGDYERFPHYGSVTIEDFVEIGANTCIDRGTLSNTIIGEGSKIDNLVHIAHNVKIGKKCIIVTLSCIAGSVKIGDGSWIAPSAVIRDGITIGKGTVVGMGAVVTKNVAENDIVAGVPAKSIKKE